MKTFISYIAEGGNIKVGDHEAAPFKVTAANRDSRVNDIHDSMRELNKSFHAEHGHDLFHGGKAHYGGSSMQLMDKNIPSAEFAKHKPTVGDVDVHVPHEHGDKLHAHLKTGARFGKYTVAGTKKHGIDVSAVMQHDNGELHQIDFIKGKHGRAEQSFLHSSHWDDVKRGVKGSHHKLLLNVAAGDTHKFSISGGLKSRTDEDDKGLQHPEKISKKLFGKDADHEKIHSFHGLSELIRDHIPASKHQDIYDRFKASTDRAGRDTDHTKAIAHLKKTLNAKDEVNEGIKHIVGGIIAAGALAAGTHAAIKADQNAPRVNISGVEHRLTGEDHGKVPRNHAVVRTEKGTYKTWQGTDGKGRPSGHHFALKIDESTDEVNEAKVRAYRPTKTVCGSCKGFGLVKGRSSGGVPGQKVRCKRCNGTGSRRLRESLEEEKIKCESCKGRGQRIKITRTGPTKVPCGVCMASGQIEHRAKALAEETEHHASVIPLVGFSPISHMGHAHDLGGAMKKLPGKKHIGISQKDDVFSPEERSHIMKKQWGQEGVNHHFTKSGGDTIGHAYHSLPEGGKKHLHILVGGDRVEMAHGLKKSLEAGKIPEMNSHKWDSIHIHTPEDSNRKHGMSGTNLRSAAVTDDHEEFHRHLGHAFSKDEAEGIRQKVKSAIVSKKIKIKR